VPLVEESPWNIFVYQYNMLRSIESVFRILKIFTDPGFMDPDPGFTDPDPDSPYLTAIVKFVYAILLVKSFNKVK
jgi:hypothetical protein